VVGDADLAMEQVKSRLTQPDELAPAHPRVDREIDERANRSRCASQARWPVSKRGRPSPDLGRVAAPPIERVGENLLLLHGDLEHAPERPVVAVY